VAGMAIGPSTIVRDEANGGQCTVAEPRCAAIGTQDVHFTRCRRAVVEWGRTSGDKEKCRSSPLGRAHIHEANGQD
jgi:hypothetical protein